MIYTALYVGLFVVEAVATWGIQRDKTDGARPLSEILSYTATLFLSGSLMILFFQLRPILGRGNWAQFIILVAICLLILAMRNFAKYNGPFMKRRFERKKAEWRAEIARNKQS